jgi:hypothetical protein
MRISLMIVCHLSCFADEILLVVKEARSSALGGAGQHGGAAHCPLHELDGQTHVFRYVIRVHARKRKHLHSCMQTHKLMNTSTYSCMQTHK